MTRFPKTQKWDAYLLGTSIIGALAGTSSAAVTAVQLSRTDSEALFNFTSVTSSSDTTFSVSTIGTGKLSDLIERAGSGTSTPAASGTTIDYFKANSDTPESSVFKSGGEAGDNNFVLYDEDGDGTFESVVQFNLDGAGGGFATGKATESDSLVPISIQVGAAAIGAVPEPSSSLLLAMGATGLALYRKRRQA